MKDRLSPPYTLSETSAGPCIYEAFYEIVTDYNNRVAFYRRRISELKETNNKLALEKQFKLDSYNHFEQLMLATPAQDPDEPYVDLSTEALQKAHDTIAHLSHIIAGLKKELSDLKSISQAPVYNNKLS